MRINCIPKAYDCPPDANPASSDDCFASTRTPGPWKMAYTAWLVCLNGWNS